MLAGLLEYFTLRLWSGIGLGLYDCNIFDDGARVKFKNRARVRIKVRIGVNLGLGWLTIQVDRVGCRPISASSIRLFGVITDLSKAVGRVCAHEGTITSN